MMTLSVECFCRFSLAMAQLWLRGSDNKPIQKLKVATHEGTGRRDRSQGPVPATKSHRVNRPIFVKNPVAGTEFWSPKSVPRIQTGLNSWDQSHGLVPAIFCLVPRVNRVVGLVPATN